MLPIFFLLLLISGSFGQNITAFLTIRVDSKNMVDETNQLMDKIVKKDQRFEPFTSDLEKLHVTIDLYHIDESNQKNALDAMQDLKRKLCLLKIKRVVFNGTGLFGSQVLFGNLTQPSYTLMRDIQQISKRTFDSRGIPSLNQYEYHPHMTIVELPKGSPQQLRDELALLEKTQFSGRQTFSGNLSVELLNTFADIYLCWMGGKQPGFYRTLDQQFIRSCQ